MANKKSNANQINSSSKDNIKVFKQDYNAREILEAVIISRDDNEAKYQVRFGEYMTKDNKLEKMILALGERMDQGFKEVREDIRELKDAVIELQEIHIKAGDAINKKLNNFLYRQT